MSRHCLAARRAPAREASSVRHLGVCLTTYRHTYTPPTICEPGAVLDPAQLEYAVQQLVLRHFHRDAGDIMSTAFAGWLEVCQDTRKLWRCRIAAVSRRVHRLANRALRVLLAYKAQRRQKKQAATQALLMAADSVQRAGLRGWMRWCNHRAAKTLAMHCALKHRASFLVTSTQRVWHSAAAAVAAARSKVQGRVRTFQLRLERLLQVEVLEVRESVRCVVGVGVGWRTEPLLFPLCLLNCCLSQRIKVTLKKLSRYGERR